MFTRYLAITAALGAAVFKASQGAWVEAAGLLGLGGGLVVLKLAERRPAIKPLAYLGFAVTAASIVTVLLRGR